MIKLTSTDGTAIHFAAPAVSIVMTGPGGTTTVATSGGFLSVRESPEEVVRLLAEKPELAEAYARLAGARAGVEALSNVVRRLVAWDEPESREDLGEILACARAALRVLDAPEVRHD